MCIIPYLTGDCIIKDNVINNENRFANIKYLGVVRDRAESSYQFIAEGNTVYCSDYTNITYYMLIATAANIYIDHTGYDSSQNLTLPAAINGSKIVDTVNDRELKYNGSNWVSIGYDSAAPLTLAWERGSIVYNTSPSASGSIGWVCVTSGTPGTWKTFGAINA